MRPSSVITLAALLLAAGCLKQPPAPGVGHYVDRDGLTGRVQRVLFLPLTSDSASPAPADAMTRTLGPALQARQIFSITTLPPEPGIDLPALDPRRPVAMKDLMRLRQATGCDAVILGAIAGFQPYPHTQTGLLLRMIDARDGRVLWAVDHFWSAADKDVQARMEEYFRVRRGPDYNPVEWRLAMVSPTAFQEFVAWEVAATLPGNSPAAAPAK